MTDPSPTETTLNELAASVCETLARCTSASPNQPPLQGQKIVRLTLNELLKHAEKHNMKKNTVIRFGGPNYLSIEPTGPDELTINLDPLPDWNPVTKEWEFDGHDSPPPESANGD